MITTQTMNPNPDKAIAVFCGVLGGMIRYIHLHFVFDAALGHHLGHRDSLHVDSVLRNWRPWINGSHGIEQTRSPRRPEHIFQHTEMVKPKNKNNPNKN